jgi:TonB family protein
MGILIILFLSVIPLCLPGQNDTIIYYSGLGRSVHSDSNAVYHERITKKTGKKYLSTTFIRKDGKWMEMYETKIKIDTDSSLTISSKSLLNPKINRFFYKTEGGFFIKDYIGSVLIQEGSSRLMFPIIKYGKWSGYDHLTAKLKTEEIYSDNQLITNRYWINDSEYITDVFFMTDKVAEFKGGDTALLYFITEHARYPKYAFNNNISGTVIVRIIVMKDGTFEGVELLKKVNIFLDLEALRVIKSLPDTWYPGEIGNEKVNMLIAVPVVFQIDKANAAKTQ